MSVIYVLLIASAFVGLGFLWLFIRSVKQGQYDDTWSPARRMLIDDDPVITKSPEEPACRAPQNRTVILDPGTRQAGLSISVQDVSGRNLRKEK